jgi:hypothetical protein
MTLVAEMGDAVRDVPVVARLTEHALSPNVGRARLAIWALAKIGDPRCADAVYERLRQIAKVNVFGNNWSDRWNEQAWANYYKDPYEAPDGFPGLYLLSVCVLTQCRDERAIPFLREMIAQKRCVNFARQELLALGVTAPVTSHGQAAAFLCWSLAQALLQLGC